jgi:hypothetical protein
MQASGDRVERDRLYAPQERNRSIPLLAIGCLVVLALAWSVREHRYISADRGLGYALGVAGLSAMVLLLAYPVRKRMRSQRAIGSVRFWFHLHMMLGVLGPVLVLLHANFQLGSFNGTVALCSALFVGASGFVGRFAYSRIHYGLFGHRARLAHLRADMECQGRDARLDLPVLKREFDAFESWAASDVGAVAGFVRALGIGARARRLRRMAVSAHASRSASRTIDAYLSVCRRVARFRTYERIFGLWHAVHLPISAFLYAAAAIHVVAVHLY